MKTRQAFLVLAAPLLLATPSFAQPPETACAYQFTSGSGFNQFTWCLTVNGNIVKLETPAGQNHYPSPLEGYGVCTKDVAHGADFATRIPVKFGPSTVVTGCVGGKLPCTISRDTTDGWFRLIQKFSENKKEKEINIDHTLTNLTAATVFGVTLTRLSGFGVNGDYPDDRADASARSVWMRDVDRVSVSAQTFSESATVHVMGGIPSDCSPVNLVAVPAPPNTYVVMVNYHLGNIGPEKKKVAKVQIRRD